MNDVKKQLITLQTNVFELISEYPDSQELLIEYGIPCASCHFSTYDTLNDSVLEFGIEEEDVTEMLEQLNEIAVNTGKKSEQSELE
ncbi:MAG: DUF1858 domain-containing protein [bacterium]|nr:DUF1858 domain-containing protein [bacterium]